MSLQRKFLKALGIEDEKAEEIISAHAETVDALKESIEEYKTKAEKVETLEAENETLKNEIAELKENAGNFDEKAKELEDLKKEFDEYKEGVKADKVKAAKTSAFRKLLKEANISEKRYDAIIKLSADDIDKITFDKDGNVKDSDDIVKAIADDWSEYVMKVEKKGAEPANPPANTGGTLVTKESIMAIKDRSARQEAIAEHPELFGLA